MNLRSVGKMFKFTSAFLVFHLLLASVKGSDQDSFADAISDVESLPENLFEDLDTKRGLPPYNGQEKCCPDIQQSLDKINSKLDDLSAKLDADKCLPGFTYLPSAKRCYKVVYESHDWYSASNKCQQLGSGSHLAAVMNAEQNSALKTFLASEMSKNTDSDVCIPSTWTRHGKLFWTSGQRLIVNDCKSPFVWKPSSNEKLPVVYTSWIAGEPNCQNKAEACLHFYPLHNFNWNDISCDTKMCPLCEYQV